MNPSKALFKGAFILTVAALITKILSAFYRIPFQNIVGDIGFYIYQQVYPFYGVAMVLSTTGFPVVISRLYAEQREKKAGGYARLLLYVSFLYLQLIGFLCFLVLYFGASTIAGWMNDPHLAILLRVVAIVFLLFPIVSVLRGYYQGIGDMTPTALSQVGEQSIRVLTILVLSYLFIQKGYSLYFVGGGAMFGSITGSMTAGVILFMFLRFRKDWEIIGPKKGLVRQYYGESKEIVKALTFQGLTICLSGMLMIFIQMADSLNLYAQLTANGLAQDAAKGLKGVYDRGQPLIQMGTVAATSMSLTLVPLITRERLAAKPQFLHHKIQLAIKVSIVIGAGASAGLWAIIKPTNIMLFENGAGSSVLGILSWVIFFTSMIATITAILQGLGSFLFSAVAVITIFPLKYVLNLALIPILGIKGAAVASLLSLAIVTMMLLHQLKRQVKIPLVTLRFMVVVLLGTAAMYLVLKEYLLVTTFITRLFDMHRLGAAIQALSAVLIGGFVFLFIILRGEIFHEEDLAYFPLGSKLKYFIARKDRFQ
ncbi:putative polysaccharide biosynthesis protein [Neobacillus sp. LXY-1]|uniref:putative polysaccharide biosynthesis protein n=1 Tax=Neobacillus sp. LXY-1 TaxID=3379133 RepID=UPI003EE008EE